MSEHDRDRQASIKAGRRGTMMPGGPRGLLVRLEAEVRRRLETTPACHDWDHTHRVRVNARRLVRAEGADPLVVEAAALLHDLGRAVEMGDQGKTCHAELGARLVPGVLRDLGVTDAAFIRRVADCVRTHRYRARRGAPGSLEAKVVYDADKLDSIGAVGIGRAFHFAGRIGARLHNHAEEAAAAPSYSREDTAYREYLVKLRLVRDRLLTATGRRLAERRHRFMERFFRRLAEETRMA